MTITRNITAKGPMAAAAAKPLPGRHRSTCARLTFGWLWPFVRTGFRRPLRQEEMPPIQAKFDSVDSVAAAAADWELQLAAHKAGTGGRPSLLRTLWRLQWGDIVLGLFFALAQGILNNGLRPIMLRFLVDAVMPESGM